MPMKTTRTGIHRGHQHEITGKFRDIAALAMVSLGLQAVVSTIPIPSLEIRKFIQKKTPCGPVKFLPVRGCCLLHQTRLGNRVMRKTERPVTSTAWSLEKPGNAVNFVHSKASSKLNCGRIVPNLPASMSCPNPADQHHRLWAPAAVTSSALLTAPVP
ncbi:MAG: hypothetical protein Ct9H90mP9_3870 [Pseudomonadota bacterium]|nr:MAG: hypothetical protein Ct9H90mP9_3870 [Pseudomonadota bacterium]